MTVAEAGSLQGQACLFSQTPSCFLAVPVRGEDHALANDAGVCGQPHAGPPPHLVPFALAEIGGAGRLEEGVEGRYGAPLWP